MATSKKSAKKPVKKNTGSNKKKSGKTVASNKKGGIQTSADTGGDRPPLPPGKA